MLTAEQVLTSAHWLWKTLVLKNDIFHAYLQDQVLLEGQGYQEDHSYLLVQEAPGFLELKA